MSMGSAMREAERSFAYWCDTLAFDLLSSLPNDELAELSAVIAGQKLHARSEAVRLLRQESRENALLQLAIARAWRRANSDVVAAAQLMPIDGSVEPCDAMLHQFGADNVLLELITDEGEDGWALAEWVVNGVASETVRKKLEAILARWSTPSKHLVVDSTAKFRIVIFGGHARDECKMTRRLFADLPFEVRWKQFEKSLGSPDIRALDQALASADAVLLVTTMVSHNIMRNVKRLTQKKGIPFRTISKATETQLRPALFELFPGVRSSGE